MGYIMCICLIFTGAIGNIVDSMFYGLVFSESTPFETAAIFPDSGGYAPFLAGKVVDMIYCPLFVFPSWVSWLGGKTFFSLFGLIVRAVAVEFASRDRAWAKIWDALFFVGSLLPALLTGVAVGNIYAGIPMDMAGNYNGLPPH